MEAKNTKSIVFDTGPIISLAVNSLLFILESLKDNFEGDFYIPVSVKKELIDKPIQTRRFKFEALRVMSRINMDVIKVIEHPNITKLAKEFMDLANQSFKARGQWIQIVHNAEMEALAAAVFMGSSALVIDERTTRVLLENPERLERILEKRLHVDVIRNDNNIRKVREMAKDVRLIRSTELAIIAYEMGFLDRFLPNTQNPQKDLVESVLWGVKLNGCSITEREIEIITKDESKRKIK